MRKKNPIALLLICTLILQMIPVEIFAVSGNVIVAVKHDDTKDAERSPSIQVDWGKVVFDPFPNNAVPGSEFFQFKIVDVSNGANGTTLTYNEKDLNKKNIIFDEDTKFEQNNKGLEPGKVYELDITPKYGEPGFDANGDPQIVEKSLASTKPVYFITDFNTQIEEGEKGLTVVWEDISQSPLKDLQFEIGWVEGELDTVQKVQSDPNSSKYIPKKGELVIENGKMKYTIEKLDSGARYSIYVRPITTQAFCNQNFTNTTGPKVVAGTVDINLYWYDVGGQLIKLVWETNDSISAKNVAEINIQTSLTGDGAWTTIKKIKVDPAGTIPRETILSAPADTLYFRVEFVFRNDGENPKPSKIVLYTPFELREEPLKPNIPKPYHPSINLKEDADGNTSGKDKKDYLVTGDTRKVEDKNFIESTFHAKVKEGKGIQLVWDIPITPQSAGEVEYGMQYDIYVSDDKATINSVKDPKEAIVNITEGDIKEGDDKHIIYTDNVDRTPVGFKWSLTQYKDANSVTKPIIPNKTYYIKIVAKRPYGGSVFAESQPTIVGITLDKNGEIFIPPVLGKPPLKLNEVTTTTAELKWREEWYEILAKNLDQYTDPDERFLAGVGSARVYTTVTTTGAAIRFSAQEGANEHILLQEKNVDEVVQKVGGRASFDENYIDRYIKLGADVQYEFNMLTYSEAVKQMEGTGLKIEEWVQTEGNNLQGWEEIKPELKKEELGLDWRFHKVENLKPNTKYLMMVRAYRMVDGEKQMQTFPSYIICTTLTDYEGPEPTPIVPQLHLKSKTDTSLSVWFKYNKDFTYEIVYSRTDDPDKAKVWPFEISDDPTNPNYVANGAERVVTINGLFPETTYNVWIRAKQKKGDKVSAWSTPVRAKTDSVKAPDAPTGLGPAAYQSILDLGLDFQGVGSDYITVEWMKNPNDKGKQTEGSMEKEYTYILEFADNVEFLDSILVETTDDGKGESGKNVEVLSKTMVKFTGLQPNRPYYVRVKTKLIFKDTESKKEIVKESEFCKWVRINTKTGNGDYDDGDNENIVIYPDKVEESYKDNIWTWEILDTQRIISEILTKNAYFFTIDMQLYRDKQDAIIRRIKMPKAVLDALINKNMEIKVLTQIGTYELPARSIAYYSSKGSAKDMIQFDFKTVLPYDIKELSKPYPYTIQKAEAFTISLKGATAVNTPLSRLDGEVKVSHKLEASTQYLYKNLQSHTYDYTLGKWVKENATVSSAEGGISHINYATPRLGIYALYNVESYADTTYTNPAMNQLLTRYEIKGLGTAYRASTVVNSDQFILLMLGIAQDQPEIDLTTPLTSSLRKKAETSGIYIESNNRNLTQEMAVSGVVKLYEMKEGRKIKASKVMGSAASAKYQENIAKAMTLGLIQNINPTAPITYGELCTLIVQVLP